MLDHEVGHRAGGRPGDAHLAVDHALPAVGNGLFDEVGRAAEEGQEVAGRSVPQREPQVGDPGVTVVLLAEVDETFFFAFGRVQDVSDVVLLQEADVHGGGLVADEETC